MKDLDLKEILDLHYKGLKAEFKASTDLLGYKIDEVINHQKITNGRVTKNEETIHELCKNPIINQIRANPIKLIVFTVLIILVMTGIVNAPTLIEYLK